MGTAWLFDYAVLGYYNTIRLLNDGEIENPWKSIFEIRNQNFCFIQVMLFDLSYLSVAAVWTKQVRFYEKMWKI